jgi:hypothetical protein
MAEATSKSNNERRCRSGCIAGRAFEAEPDKLLKVKPARASIKNSWPRRCVGHDHEGPRSGADQPSDDIPRFVDLLPGLWSTVLDRLGHAGTQVITH